MPSPDTDILSDLIRRKLSCLLHLGDLGRRQLDLIREGSMDELLDLLATKQQLLLELQRIERRLEPFRQQDPDQRVWRSPEARRQCAEQLARCEELLAEIVRQEKQSEQDLVRRRDETAARLQSVHAAGHARGAYLTSPLPAAGQVDLRS